MIFFYYQSTNKLRLIEGTVANKTLAVHVSIVALNTVLFQLKHSAFQAIKQ